MVICKNMVIYISKLYMNDSRRVEKRGVRKENKQRGLTFWNKWGQQDPNNFSWLQKRKFLWKIASNTFSIRGHNDWTKKNTRFRAQRSRVLSPCHHFLSCVILSKYFSFSGIHFPRVFKMRSYPLSVPFLPTASLWNSIFPVTHLESMKLPL